MKKNLCIVLCLGACFWGIQADCTGHGWGLCVNIQKSADIFDSGKKIQSFQPGDTVAVASYATGAFCTENTDSLKPLQEFCKAVSGQYAAEALPWHHHTPEFLEVVKRNNGNILKVTTIPWGFSFKIKDNKLKTKNINTTKLVKDLLNTVASNIDENTSPQASNAQKILQQISQNIPADEKK